MKIAIVVQTHEINYGILKNVDKIQSDITYRNTDKNNVIDVYIGCNMDDLDDSDLIESLSVKYKVFKYSTSLFKDYNFFCDKYTGKTKVSQMWYYNSQYILPAFFLQHPEYDQYWTMENDVYFTGNYTELFNKYATTDADFITNNILEKIPPFEQRKHLSTISFNEDEQFSSFICITMLSKKAITTLISYYYTGNSMYVEQWWISLFKKLNYNIVDLRSSGYVKKSPHVFEDRPHTLYRVIKTLPITADEVNVPNAILHPVKDWSLIFKKEQN